MLFGDTMCFSGLGRSEELLTNIRHASLYEFFVELFCRYWRALSATGTLIAQNKNNNLERFYSDFLQKWAALFFGWFLLGLFIGLISSENGYCLRFIEERIISHGEGGCDVYWIGDVLFHLFVITHSLFVSWINSIDKRGAESLFMQVEIGRCEFL